MTPSATLLWLTDRMLGWRQSRRKLRVLAHRAMFLPGSAEHLFVRVINLSATREVEITHIWFDTPQPVDLLNVARPLPARLRLDESFETWAPVAELPAVVGLERLVRVRLSNGKTVKSRLNKDVRPFGHVAGPFTAAFGTTGPPVLTGGSAVPYVATLHSGEPWAITGVGASVDVTTAGLDLQRRHAELTPHFRATCGRLNAGGHRLKLVIELTGPPDLERLDELTVTIRDDKHTRLKPTSSLDTPSTEQLPDHVWGPVRFVPGIGPGTTTRPGAGAADPAGRETHTAGMPIGEGHTFSLEPTVPPSWSNWTPAQWREKCGTTLRFRIEGRRDGWEPWTVPGEIEAGGEPASVEIP